MLGGMTGFKPAGANDFSDRMINSVATQSIRHLFSKCDWLDVSVRCSPPSKLLQGTIDSFRMEGRGLVIRKQFETAEMMFETDAVAIDAAALLGGKIRLRQPTQAIAQVVLTEAAINQAFEADLVQQRLKNVDQPELTRLSGGEPVSFRDVTFELQPQQQVAISARTDLPNRKDLPLQFTATLQVEKRRRILFDNPQFQPEGIPEALQSLSKTMTLGFAGVLNQMVDLERFNLDGVMLRINRLETQGKQLVFSGYAQIDHFPGIP
ncbi:MAG: DUF2993 domain-containing protein [Cyanobacteria bacterium Co-bin8]|nr:DUF2993 domain-containing protein [Cyanobacteria bacterium Co-bin8]